MSFAESNKIRKLNTGKMEPNGEIFVVPFFINSHVYPCTELCRLFCAMQYKTTLIISSELIPAVPSFLLNHELFRVAECSAPLPPPPAKWSKSGPNYMQIYLQQMGDYIESLLRSRAANPDSNCPAFTLLDSMMCWSRGAFMKFGLPVIAIFTCGAASLALEYAAWKSDVENLKPGQTQILPGLPEHMAFSYSDLTIRENGHPNPGKQIGSDRSVQPRPKKKGMPTEPGNEPVWVEETKGTIAFLVNTCDELERPFIDYISSEMGVPIWGIGPLLPQEYWKCNKLLKARPNRQSNYSEEQVMKWLDTKPHRSVIYISFGTLLAPELYELEEMAKALEEMQRPFIWVLQTGSEAQYEYYPDGLDTKVGDRGLVIHGWAPQLLILNHASVGGFLTHCGWSSAMEAIGRGKPTLAWPIKGDQFYNAKVIESHFKIGYIISKRDDDGPQRITKDVIIQGIERLMSDGEVHERAEALYNKVFKHGFPASSLASLDAFKGFASQIAIK